MPIRLCPLLPQPAPPATCSCQENVVKECEEEASVPEALAVRATPTGAVSYTSLQARLTLFCGTVLSFVGFRLQGAMRMLRAVLPTRLANRDAATRPPSPTL